MVTNHPAMQEMQVQSLVRELRSLMPQSNEALACTGSTESKHSGALSSGAWSHNKRVHVLQGKITQDTTKIPCARLDTANMPFLFSRKIHYEQETGKMLTSSAISPLISRGQQRQEDHSLRPAERHPLCNCTDWFTDGKTEDREVSACLSAQDSAAMAAFPTSGGGISGPRRKPGVWAKKDTGPLKHCEL